MPAGGFETCGKHGMEGMCGNTRCGARIVPAPSGFMHMYDLPVVIRIT